jgi:murein DD-endopeptidase MepM/ murein hydrolase activator NlpD
MRNSFSTRALIPVVAIMGLAAFRAVPAGSAQERKLSQEPTIEAAAALPVVAQEASYPAGVEQSDGPLFIWPAPGAITSPFGDHRNHPGIDIDGVTGDPVIAARTGTVVLAGMAPAAFSGYGNVVAIDAGEGMLNLYAHLSRVDVAMGQVVQQGQQIGAIGATGIATGDHLHFEVRIDNKPVDPMPYLPPR